MKKILMTLCLCSMFLIGGLFLSACGESPETKTYTISLPTSADYTITSDKTEAEAGQKITLSIILLNNELVLENILANDIVCEKQSDETFSFTMPKDNVTITVQTSHLQEVLSTNFVKLDADNLYTITTAGTDTYQKTRDLNITFADMQAMTMVTHNITSSNQSVIPNEAIQFDPITDSDLGGINDSNQIKKGVIQIDPTKIAVGTTYLTMEFISGNNTSSFSDRSTLVVKITVVPYGELTLPTVKETLVIDLFKEMQYSTGDKFCLRIGDRDHVDGSSNPIFIDYVLELETGRELTVEFDYILGHKFWIRLVASETQPDVQPGYIEEFIFEDRIYESTEDNKYTGYQNNSLMYLQANEKVTISAERNPELEN